MSAGVYNLSLAQGSYEKRIITWQDANGDVHDLTGYTARAMFRDAYADVSALVTFLQDGEHLTIDPTNGQITLVQFADETADYAFTRAFWDLEVVPVTLTDIPHGGGFTTLAFTNVGAEGIVTANAGTPFVSVVAGDIVKIGSADDTANNGYYRVASRSDTVLHLTRLLTAHAASAAPTIGVLTKDETLVERILQGSVSVSQEATH